MGAKDAYISVSGRLLNVRYGGLIKRDAAYIKQLLAAHNTEMESAGKQDGMEDGNQKKLITAAEDRYLSADLPATYSLPSVITLSRSWPASSLWS